MTSYPLLVALSAVALSFVGAGIALVSRSAATMAGLLLAASGVSCLLGVLAEANAPGGTWSAAVWVVSSGLLVLAVATYPRPAWHHPFDLVTLATVGGATLVCAVQPLDANVFGAVGLVVGTVLITHTWWRIERAAGSGRERRALVWVALVGGTAGLVAGLMLFVLPTTTGGIISVIAGAAIGPAMFIGVVRPEIVDVRVLVVRVVVALVAGIAYLATLVCISAFLEILGGQAPSIGVLATVGAVAALALHPLQVALRGTVDRLLFGDRPDPLEAATHLADSTWSDPAQALDAIRAELHLPHLSLVVDSERAATSGARSPTTLTRTLALDGSGNSQLVVGLPSGDVALTPAVEHVLRLVAPVLVQLARAHTLTEDLRLSRAQSVEALEEERRRLRRDLHDGLGPRLTGIAMTADAAANTVRSDPATAEQLVTSLRAEASAAIADIRSIVYGMRPSALDELGLVGALRQHANALRLPGGPPLPVAFTAPEASALSGISAAVEVAAYRIVVEALSNVARHSTGTSASVSLRLLGDELSVSIEDDGGPVGPWTAGVGLASMRERAAETGGHLTASPGPAGWHVTAALPLIPLPQGRGVSRRG